MENEVEAIRLEKKQTEKLLNSKLFGLVLSKECQ